MKHTSNKTTASMGTELYTNYDKEIKDAEREASKFTAGKRKMMRAKEYQEKYNPQYDYILGIDPGSSNGFICYDKSANYRFPVTADFFKLLKIVDGFQFDKRLILIENPNLNKPTFKRPNQNNFQMLKIAQNVGMNKAYATLIIEYCKLNNIAYKEVRPVTKKWTQKEFQERTGIEKRTSQHVRDAAKLIYEYLNGKQ